MWGFSEWRRQGLLRAGTFGQSPQYDARGGGRGWEGLKKLSAFKPTDYHTASSVRSQTVWGTVKVFCDFEIAYSLLSSVSEGIRRLALPILACILWVGTSRPQEMGRLSLVHPAVMAQNSDSISDSDTMQLFVLHVLTLSQLQKKKGGWDNNCYDQLYETVQKVIRRRTTMKGGRPTLPITLVLNTFSRRTSGNHSVV